MYVTYPQAVWLINYCKVKMHQKSQSNNNEFTFTLNSSVSTEIPNTIFEFPGTIVL